MLDYPFDTQLLIEGEDLSEDDIHDYIQAHIPGDCLLAVGDESLVKIHFHTNVPWACCWAGTACTRGMPAVFSMDCCPFSLGEPQSGVS